MQNAEYIDHNVKKNNSDSEIVFLCNNNVVGSSFPFRYYNMPRLWHLDSQIALRSYFDHSEEFLTFCGENYSGANIIKNLAIDFEKDYSSLTERRYKTLTTLLTHNFSNEFESDKVIIYGAGVIGRELYKKIKDFTTVICSIGESTKEKEFGGIPIVQVDKLKHEEDVIVIVSAAYDFQNIKTKLMGKFQNEDIISLDNILNLTF